jgi:hypothetical protein
MSGAALLIPVTAIQLFALPILLGSIYGTLNNQFTVRECPEYYTMGHYYDGKSLDGHAIQTNNLLIKPIVTGCYATTMVTKYAGMILSTIGTLPYAARSLAVPIAAAMIGTSCVVALVAAHVIATLKKRAVQKAFDDFARLKGIEWNETNLENYWKDIKPSQEELKNEELRKVSEYIESQIYRPMPMKYIMGWQVNNMRNTIGYLAAGLGTLAVGVTTVFLRLGKI